MPKTTSEYTRIAFLLNWPVFPLYSKPHLVHFTWLSMVAPSTPPHQVKDTFSVLRFPQRGQGFIELAWL